MSQRTKKRRARALLCRVSDVDNKLRAALDATGDLVNGGDDMPNKLFELLADLEMTLIRAKIDLVQHGVERLAAKAC